MTEATLTHTATGGDYGNDELRELPVTVGDTDSPSDTVALTVDPGTALEGRGTGITVTGTLNRAAHGQAVEVAVTVEAGTPASGDVHATSADFPPAAVTLTIPAGQQEGTATLTPDPDRRQHR